MFIGMIGIWQPHGTLQSLEAEAQLVERPFPENAEIDH